MFKRNFVIAWRNFTRNKVFSLINVLGLSIGISSALVIFLIVQYDFSFDRFEKDADRIYRVVSVSSLNQTPFYNAGVAAPLPEAVKNEIPGIEQVVGLHEYLGLPDVTIATNKGSKPVKFKRRQNIVFADNAYFDLIPYQWITGSPESSLSNPYEVVLSESRAKIYFPNLNIADVVGRQIVYDDTLITTVSGVVKDQTKNSDFNYKEFISQSTIPAGGLKNVYMWTDWTSIFGVSQLFLKLGSGIQVKKVEGQISDLVKKHGGLGENQNKTEFRLQPLSDMHFNANYQIATNQPASKSVLYGLLAVAMFLLILGCINFINLNTAQSVHRSKEIGVRKTMGSSRGQLIMQFLVETLVITSISVLISILVTPVLLKIFKNFIPENLQTNWLDQASLPLFLLILTGGVTILAGFYPALILSRLKPANVFKNQAYTGAKSTRGAWLRKGLTVSQFLIAQIFCLATLITVKQIHFVLNKDLGFKKDEIITVITPIHYFPQEINDHKNLLVFADNVKKIPGVELVSLASDAPASFGWSSGKMKYVDGKKEILTDVRIKYGDTNYLKLYHIKLLAGRNIRASDTTAEYLVNETYMHILGFQNPADVLNKSVEGIPIVGVMADFNQESLHKSIQPLALSSFSGFFHAHIGLKPAKGSDSRKSTIARIENEFKKIYPEQEFNYAFVDETIANFYKKEQDLSSLLTWAAGLAIFISCLGLLGLVIFTTNQRSKEIGIRKVLGASIAQIVTILSRDFMQLVLIASLMALPVSWWTMHKWLENFAYKTSLSFWLFVISTMLMLCIALLTLSIQTIRAAGKNPVESLRSE